MTRKLLMGAAAAGLLAFTLSTAGAAPVPGSSGMSVNQGTAVDLVHGIHRDCRRDAWGWHRHGKYGKRRACRRWGGQGRRPDYCVKVGAFYYCDF
ncbi:MAG: hypothetical protein AB7S70_04435 [Hyphomicrobium sp.]|uniref:hypothetical protein n=1 Tax=Hyphomicrobium sp. TaxID=82 RepID=UPI003D0A645D